MRNFPLCSLKCYIPLAEGANSRGTEAAQGARELAHAKIWEVGREAAAPNERAKRYVFGDFALDSAMLEHRGQRVTLAPKALETLLVLVENAGAVVDKDTLMESVWPDAFVSESGLARNISILRKTLAECGGEGPYIETISKRGYRFVAAVEAVPVATEAAATEPATPEKSPEPAQVSMPAPARPARRVRWVWLAGAAVAFAAVWLTAPASHDVRPPAEESYLIGLHLFEKRTPVELESALLLLQRSVEKRPRSVDAHAALANAYVAALRLGLPESSQGQFRNGAVAEASRALSLGANHPAALTAQGAVELFIRMDLAAAEKSLRHALSLDPNDVTASYYYSQALALERRFDEALQVIEQAQRVDPVSPLLGDQKGFLYYVQGEFREALAVFADVLARERNDTIAHYYAALCLGFLGEYEQAEEQLSQADLQQGVIETDQAWLAAMRGDSAPAERRFGEIRDLIRQGRAQGNSVLLLAVTLGHRDEAIAALEAAEASAPDALIELRIDPRVERLRHDPRYASIMVRNGLEP